MTKIKAVVFDMDGVLLDTETMCDRTWVAAAAEFGILDIIDAVNACRGCNKADTLSLLKRKYGSSFAAQSFMDRTSVLFHEMEEKEGIPLMKGAADALLYLKEKGYRLALASSTRGETVRRQLGNAGLIRFFETFTTGDMVVHSKPDPEIYSLACRSLGCAPDMCVAVEDSPNGIRSAHDAGLLCIMVPDKILPDTAVRALLWKMCTSLKDIPSVL